MRGTGIVDDETTAPPCGSCWRRCRRRTMADGPWAASESCFRRAPRRRLRFPAAYGRSGRYVRLVCRHGTAASSVDATIERSRRL